MSKIWSQLVLMLLFVMVFQFVKGQNARVHSIIPLSSHDSVNIKQWAAQSLLFENKGDYREASRLLDNVAFIYWEHNFYKDAIRFFQHSVKLNESLYNQSGIAMLNNNLAMICSDCGDFESSYDYFNKTLAYRRSQREKVGIISAQINISVVLNNLKRYDESINRLMEALSLARETNDIGQMKSCYGMLAETYERAGMNSKSMYYFGFYKDFHEQLLRQKEQQSKKSVDEANLKVSLIESEKRNKELELILKNSELQEVTGKRNTLLKSLTKKQLQLELMNRENEFKRLQIKHEKENRKNEEIKHRNQVVMSFTLMGLLLTIVVFVIKSNIERKRHNKKLGIQNQEILSQKNLLEIANKEILLKNKDITGSINYAQKIQYSILPSVDEIKTHIPEYFVFYRPKDVIGGDFYWFFHREGLSFIAVVDCTGHSVPGALMSMTVNTLLNEIMFEEKDNDPAMILSSLHRKIYKTLQQQKGDEYSQDGCDISLCVLDHDKKILHYSAARNNAYICNGSGIQVLKATQKSIGGLSLLGLSEPERNFKSYSVEIKEVSLLLMTTDGILDQLGSDDEAFGTIRLKELGLKLYQRRGKDGSRIVEEDLIGWKKDNDQQDDILVMGFMYGD